MAGVVFAAPVALNQRCRAAMGVLLVSIATRAKARWVWIFAMAFVASALLLPLAGPFALDLARVRAHQEPDWSILVQLRLSRTLLGLLAGGAFALAGALFQ